MKQFITALMLFISMNVIAAQTPNDIGNALNNIATKLGFRGEIYYNIDTGNVFAKPNGDSALSSDLFCTEVSTDYPWIFVKYIFTVEANGDHTAYECQRLMDGIEELNGNALQKQSI